MSRLFQIYDNDLSELEQILPEFADRLMLSMDNALRVKIRRVQKILSDVRWNYGPPSHVEKITSDDEPNAL